jgi:SAM-dependent methyltransferase
VQWVGRIYSNFGVDVKRLYELGYWRWRAFRERGLSKFTSGLFTDIMRIDRSYYIGKRVIDIGCGPRGSLEWLDDAALRVGIDPLMPDYIRFGVSGHAAEYVAATAEQLPFSSASFDVVTSINSLDHVDDLNLTLDEIARVLIPGGRFLFLVEVHPEPTLSEPITIPWDLTSLLAQNFRIISEYHFEEAEHRPGSAAAARLSIPFDHSNFDQRPGTLLAALERLH